MPAPLTPDDRIALVEQLERDGAARQRRAVFAMWGAVVLAAAVLALLVWMARRELGQAQAELQAVQVQRAAVTTQIAELRRTQADVERQLQESRSALAASLGVLGRVQEGARGAAVDAQLAADPAAAQLLPRVYLHIVSQADRAAADQVAKQLGAAGFIVVSTEYVPAAATLRVSDVRYYKKAEQAGAERIAAVLKELGVQLRLNYLNLENNTRVRPNHFEVWFAAGGAGRPTP